MPAEWVQQTGVIPHTTAVLAAGGLTYNDVVKVPEVNVVRAADDFKSGKLDLLFFAVGAPKVAEVAASVGGLRLLPMNPLPDSEKRMKAVRPEYYFSDRQSGAAHRRHRQALAGADHRRGDRRRRARLRRGGVRARQGGLHGNKKSLIEGHPNFRAFQEKEAGKPQPNLPYHPGAIKYFKEAGIWKG